MITIPETLPLSGSHFQTLLAEAETFHGHLCYGMYNGVKMAMGAQAILGYEAFPAKDLIVIAEIDRCLTDAVMSVTGCRFGRRTLKFRDLGRFAATFCSLDRGIGVRLAQRDGVVGRLDQLLQERGIDRHDRDRTGPVILEIPFHEHFSCSQQPLAFRPEDLPGKPSIKINCQTCGETVMDGRHVVWQGASYCRPCADLGGIPHPPTVPDRG